jgi:hypothetical protein
LENKTIRTGIRSLVYTYYLQCTEVEKKKYMETLTIQPPVVPVGKTLRCSFPVWEWSRKCPTTFTSNTRWGAHSQSTQVDWSDNFQTTNNTRGGVYSRSTQVNPGGRCCKGDPKLRGALKLARGNPKFY